MARGKKSRYSDKTQASKDIRVQESASAKRGRNNSTDFLTAATNKFFKYIAVLIFFILFCYIQKFVAIQMLGGSALDNFEKQSLDFFFDTLWKGFAIVLFLVALHDLLYRGVEEEESI
ncbi:MAG: hypothetical protein ACOX5R_07635 [bacterium]|jgi:hypothetical protein